MKIAIKNIELGQKIIRREPKRPELSSNGGDYWFWEYPILIDGKDSGLRLKGTSAEFDYCEITGWFTDTVTVKVEGCDFLIAVNMDCVEEWEEEISQEQFLDWLK